MHRGWYYQMNGHKVSQSVSKACVSVTQAEEVKHASASCKHGCRHSCSAASLTTCGRVAELIDITLLQRAVHGGTVPPHLRPPNL